MPNLSIKNVPEDVIDKLRERARRNHRSMQGELLAMVSEAVAPRRAAPVTAPRASTRERGSRTIEEVWETIHARHGQPVTGAPTAVEIIRADRDGR